MLSIRINVSDPIVSDGDEAPTWSLMRPWSDVRDDFNAMKSKQDVVYRQHPTLRGFNPFEKYLQSTRITNDLKATIKSYGVKNITRGGLKFIELLYHYDLVPRNGRISVFLNAELPGSGICALQYVASRQNCNLQWYASSYIPKQRNGRDSSDALDDEFGLLKDYPEHWLMHENNNGDCTKVSNIQDISDQIHFLCPEGVDLYTHDAGLDVSFDYNRQEEHNLKLHAGCDYVGLLSLRKGGSFIGKHYTCFTPQNICYVLCYAGLFDEFYICKPATSGSTNSETYWIGKGFKGLPPWLDGVLEEQIENKTILPLYSLSVIKGALKEEFTTLMKWQKYLCETQMMAIDRSISGFLKSNSEDAPYENNHEQQREFTDKFLHRFMMKTDISK